MFSGGFKKIAKMTDEEKARWKRNALSGLGTAGAVYAALRSGKKTNLMRTSEYAIPKSSFGRMLDRVIFGADEIGYTRKRSGKKPFKYGGTVLHTQPDTKKVYKGKKNIGDFTAKQLIPLEDKYREHMLLKKLDKRHPKASLLTSFGGHGHKKLRKMLDKFTPGFLIKDRLGYASGVGGSNFLNEGDYIQKYLAGGKIKGLRAAKMKAAGKNPKKYMVQEKMNIKKDVLTGASREIRIHAIGGKVVRGASSPRSSNVIDHLYARQAEDYFQKLLDKMPRSAKKSNMVWAPDVALTDKGLRVIETNRGSAMSGLLDPKFLYKTHGGITGAAASAKAISSNNAIYKHITGRHTPLAAGARAAGAGIIAAGAANKYTRYKEQKNETPALEDVRKPAYTADGTPANQ